jgi:hypothetical protein
MNNRDCLCGLVVEFLATDPEIQVRFLGGCQIFGEVEGLQRGLLRWPRNISLSAKYGTNFADKQKSLGRYSSLADKSQELLLLLVLKLK